LLPSTLPSLLAVLLLLLAELTLKLMAAFRTQVCRGVASVLLVATSLTDRDGNSKDVQEDDVDTGSSESAWW
ncbi:hypothetical protein T4E_7317, partial [Trichinella pseudospiralis]